MCVNASEHNNTSPCLRFIELLDVVFFQGCNSDHKNGHGCSLYAVNPRNSRGICLESFALPERSVST